VALATPFPNVAANISRCGRKGSENAHFRVRKAVAGGRMTCYTDAEFGRTGCAPVQSLPADRVGAAK